MKKPTENIHTRSFKGVRSMEVRGAQNIHSLDGTKHHPCIYEESEVIYS